MLENQKIIYPEYVDNIISVLDIIEKLNEKKLYKISAKGNPPMPLVIWKLKSYAQTSLHRVIDLSVESCRSWENNLPAVTFLLSRSILESAAYLFDFTEKIIPLIETDNLVEINDLINKWKYGDREIPGLPSITNVITITNHLSKTFPYFKKKYGYLSNFCHPNYSAIGVLYSIQNKDEYCFEIDRKYGVNKKVFSIFILSIQTSLELFNLSIDRLEKIYHELERIDLIYQSKDTNSQ